MPGTTPPDDAAAVSVAGAAFDASDDAEHASIASPISVATPVLVAELSAAELCVRMGRKIARSELSGFRVPVLEFATIPSVAIARRRQRSRIRR